MPNYKYKAFDSAGKISEGSIEASDRKNAAAILASMDLKPVKISLASDEGDADADSSALKKGGGEKASLALFKKLYQLCGSGGLPISDAVKSLSQRSLDKKIKSLCRELYKDLSEGKTLSSALEKYPDTFDACVTHLVEAGESTANLEFVFKNIIEYIERRRQLRATIIAALAYPIFLCFLASGVVLLFLFFMLPKIKSMMLNMGAEENFPIIMMELIGRLLTTGLPVVLGLAAAFLVGVKIWRKSEDGLRKSDAILLKIPALGKIAFDSDICRYSTLASTLFASGVNTTETFRLAEKSVKNADMRARFQLFRTAVNDGAPIAAALQRYGLLDSEDIDVITVGERTGSLVSAFNEISSVHSESLERRIKIMTAALGGVALGTAFLLVLTFALGIVMSIMGLSQSLSK